MTESADSPAGPVTLKQVAAQARVHPGTASRALHSSTRGLLSEATVQRVLRAAESLGYVRNHAAASLRTRSTSTVGVLLTDQGDPLWPPFCRGLEDRLAAAGYMALIGSTDRSPNRERMLLTQMRARHVDGLILAGEARSASLRADLARAGLPAVAAGSSPGFSARPPLLPSVSTDMARGMHMAVAHLAALGHRSLACITGPGSVTSRRHFLTAVTASGLLPQPRLVAQARALNAAEGATRCLQVLGSGEPCTAIIATSDLLAAGCCQALAMVGRDCPEHVSVTGMGDLPLAECLTPPLTTIRLPQFQLGARAAQMLLDLISGRDLAPATEVLLPTLVVRGSTASPRPETPAKGQNARPVEPGLSPPSRPGDRSTFHHASASVNLHT
jgi:LacI family transcriptional regulator